MMRKKARAKALASPTKRGRSREATRPLSRPKKILFAVLTLAAITALIELVLMACGVETIAVKKDPYLGFRSSSPLFEPTRDNAGRLVYRTAKNKLGIFNDQSFPVHKEPGAYRIFCLGASTTHGRPYRDSTSFCGWLRALLQTADPSRDWQVINAGGVSYASYRVARVMEELAQYDPDLFIIYSGHNEFLERRTYSSIIDASELVTQLHALWYRSRIVAVMESMAERVRPHARDAARKQYQLTGEVAPLLETSAGLDLYHRDDVLRQQIIHHYRFNLVRMVAIARSGGADVILVKPAANLGDFSPFKSQHRDALAESELRAWQTQFDEGVRAAGNGDFDSALAHLRQAERIDDRFAHLHYELGRVLAAVGQYDAAYIAFQRAMAEDVCPLRILPEMNEILSEVAAQEKVDLIDFPAILEALSRKTNGHRLIGDAYFLDHVHPTIEIHRLLGDVLLQHLVSHNVAVPTSDWNKARADEVASRLYASLDPRDHAVARAGLAKVLRWAGKVEESDRLLASDQAQPLLADDAEYLALMGGKLQQQGELDKAAEHYRRALGLNPNLREPHINLGMILMHGGNIDESITQFREALRISPDYAVAYYYLGHAFSRKSQLNRAIEQFEEALKIDPAFPEAHANIGTLLLKMNLPRRAVGEFDLELRHNPRSIKTLDLSATAFVNLGLPEEAIKRYQMALQIDPSLTEIRRKLDSLLSE